MAAGGACPSSCCTGIPSLPLSPHLEVSTWRQRPPSHPLAPAPCVGRGSVLPVSGLLVWNTCPLFRHLAQVNGRFLEEAFRDGQGKPSRSFLPVP